MHGKAKFAMVSALALASASAVQADNSQHDGMLVKLAQCPESYVNNGQKCIRERTVIARDRMDAECPPGMSYRKRYTFQCHPDPNSRNTRAPPQKPHCPIAGWDVYGKDCHSPCPKGYQAKYGQCVLPANTLSTKFMTCPSGSRPVQAFCEEQHIECKVADGIPGTFYFKDGNRCERDASRINREYTLKPKGGECPENQVQVGVNYCQDPCPEFYRARKGTCELKACIIRTDRKEEQIMCPEGTFPNPSATS
jgi:hypothetical protein